MSKPAIRRATSDDAAALTVLVRAAYAIYTDLVGLPDVSHGIARDIVRHSVWVIDGSDGLIGGAILARHGSTAHLMNVAVHPDHMGQGLGRALIATAEDHARTEGCDSIRLASHAAMTENVTLFTRLGWRIETRTGLKIVMGKTL